MVQAHSKHVRDIFNQSQFSVTSHEKLTKQLKNVYDKMPLDPFLKAFIDCLKVLLVHGEKHRVVENSLNFAAKFIASLIQAKPVSESETDNDEEEEMCPFVVGVLSFLFENHNTENQAIRFRVCQFVNKVLNSLGNEACIDDNLCDQISECMMERLQDKAPLVRIQAVMALHRLQDPTDPKCPVMDAFLFHMSSDPSADVRRAVLTNLAITVQAVHGVLLRTNDVKESVRRSAYLYLSKLCVARFTINQRVQLLTDGLKDHSAMVRECVSKVMLPTWLQFYKGSFLSLLHALDCENSTEISSLALQALFKSEPIKNVLGQLTGLLNGDKVIPVAELTPENVLYWRVLWEYLEAHPEIADDQPIDEPLPEILPELSTFCNYIREFCDVKSVVEVEEWVKQQHQYILIQLLELCKGFDLADEMGRTNLRNLCLYLLTNNYVPEDVVPVLVQVMVRVVPDVEDRLQALAEAISEVREPMTEQEQPEPNPPTSSLSVGEARQRELKQASIRVKINELKEEQDEAVRAQDFMRAQKLKEAFEQLQEELKALTEMPTCPSPVPRTELVRDEIKDRVALCKCLRIVREMVQSDSVKCLSATLRSLMQNFVLPCLQEDNTPIIRNKALEALGLFSLLDKALAQENFVMFCFQIANDDVCEIALKVTFDLLLFYGLDTFQIQEEDGESPTKKKLKKKKNLFVTDMFDDEFDTEEEENQESQTHVSSGSSGNTSNLIAMLTSLLDSASTSMRNLAMEGLYKLLMACRITSSALLSRLILMWYSPVTEGDETLRQPLGVFLNVYASHCPRSQDTLEQAFLPTLRTLMQAPVTSPLTQIDQDSVALFFVKITRAGVNKFHSKTSHIHNNMAISICNEIMDCGDDILNIGVLLKALTQLELSLDDPVYREELKNLTKQIQQIFQGTKEKRFLRTIEKFNQGLENIPDNATMRTEEVDNTAAPSQFEGSELTNNSDVLNQKRKTGNKLDRILNPHMHTLLDEKEVDEGEDDEDDERNPMSSVTTSNIVIPASPPQTQSEGDEEDNNVFEDGSQESESSEVIPSSQTHGNDSGVFKQPREPNKSAYRKQTRQGSTQKQVPSISSDSESGSPIPKKRKAVIGGKEKAQPSETLNGASRLSRGKKKAAKNQEDEGEPTSDNHSSTDENVQSPQTKTRRGETKRVVRSQDKANLDQRSNSVGSVTSPPKRHINPTEKGATLKTFQNLSPPNVDNSRSQSVKNSVVEKSPPSISREVAAKVSKPPGNETPGHKDGKPSSTISPTLPDKIPPILSKSRKSVTFQVNNLSPESPPSSAAQLKKTSNRQGQPRQRQTRGTSSENENSSNSKQSPPSRTSNRRSATSPGSEPDDSDSSSPRVQRGRLRSRAENINSQVDRAPVIAKKRHLSSSTASFTDNEDSVSDSTPPLTRRHGQLRGSNSSRQQTITQDQKRGKPSKGSSSDIDSDGSSSPTTKTSRQTSRHPIKDIAEIPSKTSDSMRIRTLRRSISSSDAERTSPGGVMSSSKQTAKSTNESHPRSRRSSASTAEGQLDHPSPLSATQSNLKKNLRTSVDNQKKPVNSDSEASSSPSPSRARRSTASSQAEPQGSKKRLALDLTSTSSDGFETASESPNVLLTRLSRERAKTASKESTAGQAAKKMRTRTPNSDSPLSQESRRSLRSQTATPSPRTRSGKI